MFPYPVSTWAISFYKSLLMNDQGHINLFIDNSCGRSYRNEGMVRGVFPANKHGGWFCFLRTPDFRCTAHSATLRRWPGSPGERQRGGQERQSKVNQLERSLCCFNIPHPLVLFAWPSIGFFHRLPGIPLSHLGISSASETFKIQQDPYWCQVPEKLETSV